MLRALQTLVLATLLLSPLGCNSPAAKGEAEAERDIAAGTLKIKTYGKPAPWFAKAGHLLEDRLGVEFESVAGCDVTHEFSENVRGYNSRMDREIAARFGPNAVDDIFKQAEEEYKREHAIP
jgi:hypothetical protein